MHGCCSVLFHESNDLLTRNRVTVSTETELRLLLLSEILPEESPGLISHHTITPTHIRLLIFIRTNLHDIAALKLCLHRTQLSINTRILSMLANLTMNLKGKVESRCPLGQVHHLSFRCKHHNIVIIAKRT